MKLVLISYVNRSGSTYLAQQLSRYKDVLVCPEADCLVKLLLHNQGKRFNRNKALKDLTELHLQDRKFKFWNICPESVYTLNHAVSGFDMFVLLLDEYRKIWKPDAGIIVFKYELLIRLFRELSESARESELSLKMILLLRDPRAVFASQKRAFISPFKSYMNQNPFFTSANWNVNAGKVHRMENPSEILISIRYEDLIQNKDIEMKRLGDFLDIRTEKGMTETGDLAGRIPDDQQSLHENILKSPVKSRTDAWKNELKPEEVRYIEKKCHDSMERAGYFMTLPNVNIIKYRFKVFCWSLNACFWYGKHFILFMLQGFKV